MARLEVAIAELAIVRAIATANTGGFDSDLEFIGCGICDGSSFLIQVLACSVQHIETPHEGWEVWDVVNERGTAYQPQIPWPVQDRCLNGASFGVVPRWDWVDIGER